MKSILVSCLAAASVTLSVTPALADQSPFVGTWKLDLAKSSFTGDSITYKALPNGKIDFTYGTVTHYAFPCDGTKYATSIAGYTATCTKTSATTYAFTSYANGKLTDKDADVISNGGKTLTDTDTSYRPDGKTTTSSTTYERVGSGTGIAGTWKSTKVTASSPDVVSFASSASGLTMTNPAYKWTFAIKTDGSKSPLTGPTVPKDAYLISTADGPSTLKMTYYIAGKSFGDNTLTVSADGTSMTWASQAPGAALTTAVYDKK